MYFNCSPPPPFPSFVLTALAQNPRLQAEGLHWQQSTRLEDAQWGGLRSPCRHGSLPLHGWFISGGGDSTGAHHFWPRVSWDFYHRASIKMQRLALHAKQGEAFHFLLQFQRVPIADAAASGSPGKRRQRRDRGLTRRRPGLAIYMGGFYSLPSSCRHALLTAGLEQHGECWGTAKVTTPPYSPP